MKKILFILFLVILLAIFPYVIKNNNINSNDKSLKVTINIDDKTIKEDINDYLLSVVAGEMPANFEIEAIKAQVVACRTYVLSRNLKVDNTTNTQVYLTDKQMRKKWGNNYNKYRNKIKKAIKATKNEVMTYKGKYIEALFFASSNGNTNNSEDYFEYKLDYLRSVSSKWDLEYITPNKKTYTTTQLSEIFNTTIKNIKIKSYYKSGYVNKVLINKKEYSGKEIRTLLNLPSSSIDIKYSKNKYTFITTGNGHGVGMSQYGAQGMAKEKKTYKEILHHYYKNINIINA